MWLITQARLAFPTARALVRPAVPKLPPLRTAEPTSLRSIPEVPRPPTPPPAPPTTAAACTQGSLTPQEGAPCRAHLTPQAVRTKPGHSPRRPLAQSPVGDQEGLGFQFQPAQGGGKGFQGACRQTNSCRPTTTFHSTPPRRPATPILQTLALTKDSIPSHPWLRCPSNSPRRCPLPAPRQTL